jgi:hypothetical protein
MVVMITNRNGKNPLGLLLLDYEPVEVVPDFLGPPVKTFYGIESFVSWKVG